MCGQKKTNIGGYISLLALLSATSSVFGDVGLGGRLGSSFRACCYQNEQSKNVTREMKVHDLISRECLWKACTCECVYVCFVCVLFTYVMGVRSVVFTRLWANSFNDFWHEVHSPR